MTNYFPAFCALKEALGISFEEMNGTEAVSVPAPLLRHLILCALSGFTIDTDLYARQNPDLAKLNEAELRRHFILHGYYEGRPFPQAQFDERYYLSRNADVLDGVARGKLKSALDHYQLDGVREGRSPAALSEEEVSAWNKTLKTSRRRPKEKTASDATAK